MASMEPDIALTETLREAATIIMLAGAGYLGGRYFTQRFAAFIYCFAIWDIFYYVFLKALIGWPGSLLTWDILFLIPVMWTGPVLSPVIVSLTMILFAAVILYLSKHNKIHITPEEWSLLIAGSFILIISFTWDYLSFTFNHAAFTELYQHHGLKALWLFPEQYIPAKFPWILFIAGELIITAAITLLFFRNKRNKTT